MPDQGSGNNQTQIACLQKQLDENKWLNPEKLDAKELHHHDFRGGVHKHKWTNSSDFRVPVAYRLNADKSLENNQVKSNGPNDPFIKPSKALGNYITLRESPQWY